MWTLNHQKQKAKITKHETYQLHTLLCKKNVKRQKDTRRVQTRQDETRRENMEPDENRKNQKKPARRRRRSRRRRTRSRKKKKEVGRGVSE